MIKRNMFRGITERSFSGLIWAVVLMCYSMIVIPHNARAETCAAIDYNITTIAAGWSHTVGLKKDGTVVAVGYNNTRQLNVSGWTNIKSIAAGIEHTVGLKEDGTVVAAGSNGYGQLNVSNWTNIKAIAAGGAHTVGLKEDGTVIAIGDNPYYGQLNVSSWTNIKAIAAGRYHTVGLKEDGTVVAVGNNYGQSIVSSWTNIKAIAAGGEHTVGLKEDGTVVAVGNNGYGQLNVSGWTKIKAIAAGWTHTVGLKEDGTAVATGRNESGQLTVSDWTNIKAIAAGGHHTVGLKEDGTVVGVGNNSYGQSIILSWTNNIKAIAAGEYHTVGLKEDGTVVAVGYNAYHQSNVSSWTKIKAIAAGAWHTVGLKEDGTVLAVGYNGYGLLNVSGWTNIKSIAAGPWHTVGLKEDGTVVAVGGNGFSKLNVSSWTKIKAIAAGAWHTVGLKEDGTVLAAGANWEGQSNVSGWTNIKAIAAGIEHTVGLKEDGTVVAVGKNLGQLNVSGWTNIKSIAAGPWHTVGLKEDGTVVDDMNVSNWTNIKAIAASGYHTVGLKEDGTVVAVGSNYYGQLNVSDWTIRQPACLDDVPTPDISSSTTLISFGAVELGSAASQSLSISNTGTAELSINSISISGSDSNQFSQTNNCSSVAPNTSCSITITFTPASLGAKNASLNIASNDPDTPTLTIPLTGSGVDTIPPTTSSMISGVPGTDGWYGSDVHITLTATDNYGGSGAKEIHYSINGTETVAAGSTASFTVSAEGSHSISYFARDNAGNSEAPHVHGIKIDKTPPAISASSAPVPNANGWNNSDVAVTFTCNDTISGIASCPSPITVSAEGAGQVITGTAVDKAGNTSTAQVTLNTDKTTPTITASVTPSPNANGWNNTDVTVTFTCSDTLSGIASCPAPVIVTTEGTGQVITGEAVDKAGNKATASVTLNIDKTPPSITSLTTNPGMLWPPNHKMVAVTLGGSAADYGSDIASVVLSVSDEYGVYNMTGLSFGGTIQLEAWREGTDKDGRYYTISAVVTDRAGNRSTATTAVLVPHDMR